MADADTLKAGILKAVAGAESLDALEEVRVAALGRKGSHHRGHEGAGRAAGGRAARTRARR